MTATTRRIRRASPRRPGSREPTVLDPGAKLPYPPSWFDGLKVVVESLPGPFWLPYLTVWLILFAIETIVSWSASAFPIGTFHPFHAVLTIMLPGALCLIHALDRLADRAFQAFRPVLHAPESEADELRLRLTTMPQRGLGAAMVFFVLFGILLEFGPLLPASGGRWLPSTGSVLGAAAAMQLATSPLSLVFNTILLLLTWLATGALIYHTIRQLTGVSRIYTQRSHIDLLKPGALYSLSRISAATALGMIAIVYLILAADQRFFRDPRNLIGAGMFGVLAALAFVLPLLGAHRALVAEKTRMLDETAERLMSAITELHRRVDQADFTKMDALNKAISSLDLERSLLQRVPTWPWQPETLRTVVVALLLPLLLWIAQAVLGRLLGP